MRPSRLKSLKVVPRPAACAGGARAASGAPAGAIARLKRGRMLASRRLMAVTQPAAAPAAAPPAAAPPAPRAPAVLAVALLAACAYAAFASGATRLVDEARLDAGLAVVALAAAAAWLSPRTSRAGWTALALLAAFAVWCGISLAWSVLPDATWTETNRAIAYAVVVGCAFALGG